MPSLKEEVLILIREGILFYLSNPCRYFRIGAQYNPSTFYKTIQRLEREGLVKKSKKDRKTHLSLTEQGKKYIKKHRPGVTNSPRLWDKKMEIGYFRYPGREAAIARFSTALSDNTGVRQSPTKHLDFSL